MSLKRKGFKQVKNQMTTLDKLEIGQRGVVTALTARGKLRRRLQDMGVVKNVELELINSAPLGDPIEIKVRGFDLALRKNEAAQVEVKVTSGLRLSALRTGDTAVVEGFEAGRGLRRHLLAMGIVPGRYLQVVRNDTSGPVVVSVKDARVMLGRGMVNKILVGLKEPVDETPDGP
jgi:ferrous iron transport protein A